MTYARFMTYNVVGGILWVVVCSLAGYFFGNLKIVQENFSLVILGIIVVSVLPAVFEFLREWRRRARDRAR
jgi:membrane-associated protein